VEEAMYRGHVDVNLYVETMQRLPTDTVYRGSERELVGLWERSAMQLDRAKMVTLLLLLLFAFC
jgi:hypothetical protein